MTQPDCTKMVISQLLLAIASSNMVGRKSKFYFIIKFSLLLSIILCWREKGQIPAKQLKMTLLQVFSDLTTQTSRFGQKSCVADEQACVVGSFEFNKHPVLKIVMINGLNFQTV